MNKQIIPFIIVILLSSSCKNEEIIVDQNSDYKQEMRNFVQEISNYAAKYNSKFIIIPQNGVELVSKTGTSTGSPDLNYLKAINGIGQEDLFFGYDRDDKETPETITNYLTHYIDMAVNNGIENILVTDYCSSHSKMEQSLRLNKTKGYISFAADHRELDNIPLFPPAIPDENRNDITDLKDARNFLYLINPEDEFSTKQSFITALEKTNYDLIIMDLFYKGEAFSAGQIARIKNKANGGKRLLISYMSIGEAEDYRYYWKTDWNTGNPPFILKENPDWEGNFKVRYWDPEWKKIIYSGENSYLNQIIDSGFDGVYLDIIDAYEYFE